MTTSPKNQPSEKEWWTIHEVADYLGMTIGTAQNWMWRYKVRRSPTCKTLTRKEWVDQKLIRGRKKRRTAKPATAA